MGLVINPPWDVSRIRLGHIRSRSLLGLRICLPIDRIYLKIVEGRVKAPYYNLTNVRIKSAHI